MVNSLAARVDHVSHALTVQVKSMPIQQMTYVYSQRVNPSTGGGGPFMNRHNFPSLSNEKDM